MDAVRLFRAWSMVDNFLGQEQVRLDWFVVGRTAPPAPYEELIRHYDENDENACYDEILVNELLQEPELEELQIYLSSKHQIGLQREEVSLPVKSGTLSYGLLLISGERGFYALADEKEYDLSVSVLGHYDAKEVDISASLSETDIETGKNFLEIVFEHMNVAGVDGDDLNDLLQKIYTEKGLQVMKTKP